MRHVHILVTCEHAGNQVPRQYQFLFKDKKVLTSHRGVDEGAIAFAEQLSDGLRTKLFETRISRLLVECNRSIDNPQLFSEFTSGLKDELKQSILKQYYHPYRQCVEKYIRKHVDKAPVLHLSMHTFTPVLNGLERTFDIGLLFDEARTAEGTMTNFWIQKLNEALPSFKVLKNEPYKGADDGFTTYLRTQFSDEQYMGIEIEINQKWSWTTQGNLFIQELIKSLEETISELPMRILTH